MKGSEFMQHLANLFGMTAKDVDGRVSPLRSRHRVTVAGRGIHAPHLGARDLVMMALAMASPRVVDAGAVAIAAADLPVVPPPGGAPAEVIEGRTLAGFLTATIEPGAGLAVDRVEIESAGRFAWVRLAGCEPILFASPEIARDLTPKTYGAFGSTAARYVAFGAGFFSILRMALDEPDDEEGEILPD